MGRDVFKTISIGTFKDVELLRNALRKSGVGVGPWAGDILNNVILSNSKRSLDLVVLCVSELGFSQGAKLKDIYETAIKNKDLDLCPSEVGPQLLRQYRDQPDGKWLITAMEPIKDSNGVRSLFIVSRDGNKRWLGACGGNPNAFYNADNSFVFTCRK